MTRMEIRLVWQFFSNAEIEKMATDERYAAEKMQGVEGAVKMWRMNFKRHAII